MKNIPDPGLRRDDESSAGAHSMVIPAQAGIQPLSSIRAFDVIRSNRFSVALPMFTTAIFCSRYRFPGGANQAGCAK